MAEPLPHDERVPPKEYLLLAFLTLISVMNFVDRQLLASFANFVVPDLGLTDTQFGLLTGFAFILFYAFVGLFAGALADTLHRPRLMAAGLALWSGLTAVSGAARGFVSLAVPRMFIGVGESQEEAITARMAKAAALKLVGRPTCSTLAASSGGRKACGSGLHRVTSSGSKRSHTCALV